MKLFIKKILAFTLLIIIIHFILGFLADGTTDDFYLRFTSSKQKSLIIGASRAAQGIQPQLIDSILDLTGADKIYNFSFTGKNSPYGKVYYNAIQTKLNTSNTNGIFIVTVDPWSVSVDTSVKNNNELDFDSDLYRTNSYNSSPNYNYLIKNYKNGWGSILLNKIVKNILLRNKNKLSNISGSWTYLHDNGWLEVFTSMDSIYVQKNTKTKVEYYEQLIKHYQFSAYRFEYLSKTIQLLQNYGTVYLVRLPAHKSFIKIEDAIAADFDLRIEELSIKNNIKYINLIGESNDYQYTDGSHLYKSSAAAVTIYIGKLIKSYQQENK